MQVQKDDNGQAQTRRPCGLGRRLLAMAYDAVAVIALMMSGTALVMLAGFRELSVLRDPGYSLYLLAIWCAYFLWSWHLGGMTLGMRAWHVRIENAAGGLPGWRACLTRFGAAWLSGAALGAGFVWGLLDPQSRCWHDRLSGTRLYRG